MIDPLQLAASSHDLMMNRCLFGLLPKRHWAGLSALMLWLGAQGAVHSIPCKPPDSRVTQVFTIHDDFQGDSLDQWASYPPVQDIGYDPTLAPTTAYDAPGGRALMRVLRPNRSGASRFGFIKRVRLVMATEGRLSFSYQLRWASSGSQIEVGLAAADGHRYATRLSVNTLGWTNVEVPFCDLRNETGEAGANGIGIEAVFLIANLAQVDPDITYRFIIDNVAVAAARLAGFAVSTPQTQLLEPWGLLVSATAYRSGETFSIGATAPVRLARAECVLESPAGRSVIAQLLHDDGAQGDQRSDDNIWSNRSVYTLQDSDPAGLWVASLRGTASDGQVTTTSLRFIVRPSGAVAHPRLFFKASDRESLVARTRHRRAAALWAKLWTAAKDSRATGNLADGGAIFDRLDTEYLIPSLLGYFDIFNRARARIAYNSLEAYITHDVEALAAAKSALLEVARWGRWAPPWFEARGQRTYYPVGELAADVAFAYDLLYGELLESERVLVRRALIEHSIIPTYKEYVLDNRIMANTSNWIAHTVGGALVAAAAIADDGGTDESKGQFQIYLNGLLLKLEDHMAASYLRDGSYGEGTNYHEFDLESLPPALLALKRVFGIDYWNRTHVLKSLTYPLYTLGQPTSTSLDMGDSHPPNGQNLALLVNQSKDPTLRWYYDLFEHSSINDFLFFDDSVPPEPPSLPVSRLFPEKGNAVFRTGWGPTDWMLLFRAGPNFNHQHADQGSFLLNAFGENLVTEAGRSHYYNDPYYAKYFTQAVGHNTVLVDDNPESQVIADTPQFKALNAYPRMTDAVISEHYDAVGSDLAAVYRGRLKHFYRRIVFVKPHYFVVYDNLETNDAPARFNWLLHLPDRQQIQLSPGTAVYSGQKAALAVRNMEPADAKLSVRQGKLSHLVFATSTPSVVPSQPAFLDLETTAPARSVDFLVALVPAQSQENAYRLASRLSKVASDDWIGLRAEHQTGRELVMFRRGNATGEADHGEWATDAAAWTITLEDERVKVLAVHLARTLRRAGRTLVASQHPISLAADYRAGSVEAACDVVTPGDLRLFIGESPYRVQLDGREMEGPLWSYGQDDKTLSVRLPEGQHRLRIELGLAARPQ
jgi:Heparinase II/III-like protein